MGFTSFYLILTGGVKVVVKGVGGHSAGLIWVANNIEEAESRMWVVECDKVH